MTLALPTDFPFRDLVVLRDDGTIGDAAFQRVEEEIDWAELDWGAVPPGGAAGRRGA